MWGEKLDEFEPFHPERMASRILGMGDVVSLVEKAVEAVDLDDAQRMEEKMRKGQFSLEDFLDQLRQMKKLGPLESIVSLLPGGAEALKGADMRKQEKEFLHMEAMICGMTPQERRNPHILNARRRQRIAKGSGVTVTELNTDAQPLRADAANDEEDGQVPADDGQDGRGCGGLDAGTLTRQTIQTLRGPVAPHTGPPRNRGFNLI